MKNIVYIAISMDGFIAMLDGGIEWLQDLPNPTQSDYGFEKFMKGIDALVMGRKTFEKVLSFSEWPYKKKVFVLSNTLKTLDKSLIGKVEIVSGEVVEVVRKINSFGYNNLYIDGGETISNFLNNDLIDEMIITRFPVLLGQGVPLFKRLNKMIRLKHILTDVYDNGLVQSTYGLSRLGLQRIAFPGLTFFENKDDVETKQSLENMKLVEKKNSETTAREGFNNSSL